jgi:hypothetical protein
MRHLSNGSVEIRSDLEFGPILQELDKNMKFDEVILCGTPFVFNRTGSTTHVLAFEFLLLQPHWQHHTRTGF